MVGRGQQLLWGGAGERRPVRAWETGFREQTVDLSFQRGSQRWTPEVPDLLCLLHCPIGLPLQSAHAIKDVSVKNLKMVTTGHHTRRGSFCARHTPMKCPASLSQLAKHIHSLIFLLTADGPLN